MVINHQNGLGKCPQCSEWNTFVEEIINNNNVNSSFKSKRANKPVIVSDINYSQEERIVTKDSELNRVLGGGIVPGSLILLGVIQALENLRYYFGNLH